MDVNAMIAYRVKVQRIMANGVDGSGMLAAVRNLAPGMNTVSARIEFDAYVTNGPGSPRSVTIAQEMMGDLAPYQPGAAISVKINAQNPDEAMMLGPVSAAAPAPSVPAAAPSEDDKIGRLEQLAQLRDSGAVTPEEFQQQKAGILGG